MGGQQTKMYWFQDGRRRTIINIFFGIYIMRIFRKLFCILFSDAFYCPPYFRCFLWWIFKCVSRCLSSWGRNFWTAFRVLHLILRGYSSCFFCVDFLSEEVNTYERTQMQIGNWEKWTAEGFVFHLKLLERCASFAQHRKVSERTSIQNCTFICTQP